LTECIDCAVVRSEAEESGREDIVTVEPVS